MNFKMIKYLLIIFTITTAAQTNFKIENNSLNWQKVYSDTTSINNIILNLKQKGFDVTDNNTYLDIKHNYTNKDLTNLGMKWSSYPPYIQTGGNYSGIIEFKSNKIRVTITKIKCNNSLNIDQSDPLDDYVVKKSEIKTNKHHQKALELLDIYFNNIFSKLNKKSNW